GRPVVFVRHDSVSPGSPLRPGSEGNGFKEYVERRRGKGGGAELLVTKTVNSAFLGSPDLAAWLREAGIRQVGLAGVQANGCGGGGASGSGLWSPSTRRPRSVWKGPSAGGGARPSWRRRPRCRCTAVGSRRW